MRTRTTVAIAVAAGLVGAGLVGVPAVLAADDDTRPRDGYGPMWSDDDERGPGGGWMMGRQDGRRGGGMMGRDGGWMMGGGPGSGFGGRGAGDCLMFDGDPEGELTAAQKEQLQEFAEREKLAADLYEELADATDDVRFDRIAFSETHHLQALQAMMDRYDVDDPTKGKDAGEFSDEGVADDYAAMLEDGSGSLDDALEVARDLEQDDVDRLGEASEQLEDGAPDVARVYEHLAESSEHHLEAFSR